MKTAGVRMDIDIYSCICCIGMFSFLLFLVREGPLSFILLLIEHSWDPQLLHLIYDRCFTYIYNLLDSCNLCYCPTYTDQANNDVQLCIACSVEKTTLKMPRVSANDDAYRHLSPKYGTGYNCPRSALHKIYIFLHTFTHITVKFILIN
jgi:hypothetical protein